MEKLNEAVETLKRDKKRREGGGEVLVGENCSGASNSSTSNSNSAKRNTTTKVRSKLQQGGRPRSQSVDGVTFAGSSNTGSLETLMEHSPLNAFENVGEEDDTTKRPLEGILKEPSMSNKRSR